MATRFRHAALVGKYQARGIGPVLEDIAQLLIGLGLEVTVEADTAAATGLSGHPAASVETLGRQCDLAVVVGGDGTMLGIAREFARHDLPLVGINQGRLGFITDIPAGEFRPALAAMVTGDCEEEQRTMIEGEVWRDGERLHAGFALNEVVVNRGTSSGMVEVRVAVGGEPMAHLRADGLIVATPTGSTAYALAAGGPIVHPAIAGWVIVPIASHTLTNRPIVLPDHGEVVVEIAAGRDATLNFDMHRSACLLHGDAVRVRRSAHRVRFLHPRGWSYFGTLRRKLRWYE